MGRRCVKGEDTSVALRTKGAVDRGCATQKPVLEIAGSKKIDV
jgi:hypothetical protein